MDPGAAGATGATEEAEDFAALLRELKERSGLSYGTLAKRLHMSTSTLHRYCNATAVPADYAPVERLARLCRATRPELVELHRRWIVADAARRRRGAGRDEAGRDGAGRNAPAGAPGEPERSPAPGQDARPEQGVRPEQGTRPEQEAHPEQEDSAPAVGSRPGGPAGDAAGRAAGAEDTPPGPAKGPEPTGAARPGADGPGPAAGPGAPVPARTRSRRYRAPLAVAVAVTVTAITVLAAYLATSADRGDRAGGGTAGSVDTSGPARAEDSSAPPSGSPTPSASRGAGAGEQSAGRPSAGEPERARPGAGGATGGTGVPLTVATRPYVYAGPCSQNFLVDSEPERVGPPAGEQDAPRWAAAYGAVSSGEQRVGLTVQGTGKETVVLEALHVRVVSKGAPLAWNDYAMGSGCGGDVGTTEFSVDLDGGSPAVTAGGVRSFPYKVSESDPEVFYVTARTTAYDVRWDLTLEWSSGDRRGSVRVDNGGTPFRTSSGAGRPAYAYPPGGDEWIAQRPDTS
ncbi:transcriptional regulator [Streptomyces zingiberis]|uniref:Helix-turn-helix domain-containing protein n=1 Tax=Streptomyces zingiberis TaxID=2053010 RepID=A0ABX1C7H4_9ACTN|nr:helix-turn-helix transcriptional regulator [Streptomyces zingiberis]NJQ02914.1 helix-turn-helix domain-containing protein [Streptomyces zingiberis]